MIGQTVVNAQIGRARTRISTLVAGLFVLLLVAVLSPVWPPSRWRHWLR